MDGDGDRRVPPPHRRQQGETAIDETAIDGPRLDTLPDEVLEVVLGYTVSKGVAMVGAACRNLARLARCDRTWHTLYRRDFGIDAPPPEHKDHALYGKDIMWLYALAARPKGRFYVDARAPCRWVGRIEPPNGKVRRSGEFTLGTIDDDGCARLKLDGYGVRVEGTVVYEGIWREGSFVGPGRVWDMSDGCEVRCAAFDDDLCADGYGHQTWPTGAAYHGDLHRGRRHGFGTYEFDDHTLCHGEWGDGNRQGRAYTTRCGGCPFAGQMIKSKRAGRGVKRLRSGRLVESFWEADNVGPWCVDRCGTQNDPTASAVMRKHRASAVDGVSPVHHTHIMLVDGLTAVLFEAGDSSSSVNRVVWVHEGGGGNDVLVGTVDTTILLAVADTCPDPRLAGRRFFGIGWCVPPTADGQSFGVVIPSDPRSIEARAFALYLASPRHCLVGHTVSALLLDALAQKATEAGVTIDWTDEDDAHDSARRAALGRPFGEALRNEQGGAHVRCFLTGTLVPVERCVLATSGRLYESEAFATWCAIPAHALHDPETGEILDTRAALPWRPWMLGVPADVLRGAMSRAANMPFDVTSKSAHLIAEDRLRAFVAFALGETRLRSMEDVLVTAIASRADIDVARDAGAGITRGFDRVAVRNVELRHPEWEPRGPWRLGPPPGPLPEDLTVDEHERPDAGPVDHWKSHGILRVALASPSFVGADIEGAFFFGHTFTGASFAGARLDRCAFIGCHFVDCVFADARVVACGFYECTPDDVVARIKSKGGIFS